MSLTTLVIFQKFLAVFKAEKVSRAAIEIFQTEFGVHKTLSHIPSM